MSDSAKVILLLAEALTVAGAIVVTFHPNILYATLSLLISFLGVAALFLFAGADFIAGVQVVVYVGGVTILILFAIMLTQALYGFSFREVKKRILFLTAVLAVVFIPLLWKSLSHLASIVQNHAALNQDVFSALPKTKSIGEALLTTYLLPFEAITILLLGALVGAVYLARPK